MAFLAGGAATALNANRHLPWSWTLLLPKRRILTL
jgi:hypothetical protein